MPSAPPVCFILVALLPATGTAREAPSGPTLDLHSLPPGPRPLPVTIGVYLIDLERIEEATGTYALAGYLELEWHDPRLSREAFPNLNRTRLSLQDIWWPNIEFFNQHEPRNIANLQLGVRDDGTVVYEERFRVRLGSELNFRRFPFDRQDLLLQIESFRHDATQMILVIRPGRQLKSLGAFLPDWSILGASEYLKMDDNNPDRKPYAMYVFVTQVQRKSASYIWNVLLPFALITVLSWVVFWIRNKDMSNIAITTLVAAVAFAFVVSGSRPRLSCMTFMDSVFLTSYFIIFLANVVSVAVHYMESPDRPSRSRVLVRTARWLLPVLYVASLCLSIGLFLLR